MSSYMLVGRWFYERKTGSVELKSEMIPCLNLDTLRVEIFPIDMLIGERIEYRGTIRTEGIYPSYVIFTLQWYLDVGAKAYDYNMFEPKDADFKLQGDEPGRVKGYFGTHFFRIDSRDSCVRLFIGDDEDSCREVFLFYSTTQKLVPYVYYVVREGSHYIMRLRLYNARHEMRLLLDFDAETGNVTYYPVVDSNAIRLNNYAILNNKLSKHLLRGY